MSCAIKEVVLNDLKKKNILSNTREILDHSRFDKVNSQYTKHAIEKYDLPTNGALLFDIESQDISRVKKGKKTIFRAIPNEKLFNVLNDIVVDYKDKHSESIYKKVDFNLKSVDILSSDKAIQVFAKGKKNGWDLNKILTELQIPKEQKQIILDKNLTDNQLLKETDKIIWGHPTLGKTTLRETSDNILDFDTDFKPDISKKYNLPNTRVARDNWRKENPKKWDNEMRLLWNKAKKEANSTNKRLVVSDMIFLKEFENDFDRIVTTSKATFAERSAQRGDSNIDNWKDNIDKTIRTVNKNKVVNTNSYFSEIITSLREDIITSLLADNSFVVEVNTAINKGKEREGQLHFNYSEINDTYSVWDDVMGGYKSFPSAELAQEFIDTQTKENVNSSYYSNLTVPGGTNYTENEIATPDIVPNIKGHAQFSTDNGIGWFRSDEQTTSNDLSNDPVPVFIPGEQIWVVSYKEGRRTVDVEGKTAEEVLNKYKQLNLREDQKITLLKKENFISKTRRILEVQSDLFQKGRDKDLLDSKADIRTGHKFTTEKGNFEITGVHDAGVSVGMDGTVFYKNSDTNEEASTGYKNFLKIIKTRNIPLGNTKGNDFLQLLNKKGNWVNFFIQSIVKDSVKKGYEKVLFPTGETAAKVEGHQTIAEEIKGIDIAIKNAEDNIKNKQYQYLTSEGLSEAELDFVTTKEDLELELKGLNKQKSDLKTQGLEKLKPIEAFYTNRVTNILNKLYDVNEITDEHGNTWNEVDLTNEKNNSEKILLKKDIKSLEDKNTPNILTERVENNDKTKEATQENFNNFILFNNQDKTTYTAKDILDNIKSNFKGFTNGSYDIIDKLIPILERSNATVKLVSQSQMADTDTAMQYNDVTNEIRISKDKLDNTNEEYAIRTFLHEVVHSITVTAYNKPNTLEHKMFRNFMDGMFAKYKELSKFNNSDNLSDKNYGFTSVEEFIAEIMTTVEFQNEIKSLEKGNLWNQFVDFIRTLVGLKKTSDYNAIIDSITTISETFNAENNYSEEGTIFQKTDTKKDNIKDIPYDKLNTIEDKLNHRINGIKDSLEKNIKKYDSLIKKVKNPTNLERHSEKQKVILKQIEELDDTRYWDGITAYILHISKSIASLESHFAKEDINNEDTSKTVNLYKQYLESNALVDEVSQLLVDASYASKELPISKEQLDILKAALTTAEGKKIALERAFTRYSKEAAFKMFNNRANSREVMYNFKKKLKGIHKDLKLSENFNKWFIRQIDEEGAYKDELDSLVADKAKEIVEGVAFDISSSAALFNTDLNTNSDLVQLMSTMFTTTNNKIIDRKRKIAVELQDLHTEFIKEKGNRKPSELYKNLYEKTKDGKTILKGKYSIKFKEEYEAQRDAYNAELEKVKSKYGVVSGEVATFYDNSKFKTWKYNNLKSIKTADDKFIYVPADKWITNESKLSPMEVKVLHKSRLMLNVANKETYGINSLLSPPLYTAMYYSLPSVTKSDLERTLEGNASGIIKDKIKDLTTVREDDLGYEEEKVSSSKHQIHNIKLNYRGDLDPSQQSLDLMTMVLAEAYNGINYQEKNKIESEAKIILDIAKNKSFYETTGFRVPILGLNITRNRRITKDGADSNVYKRLESLVETNLYDIMHKNAGKWGKADVNKIVGFLNGATATIGLAVNEVSAVANILNGKSQLFLESIAGNVIGFKEVASAEKEYFADIADNLKDVNKPISTSMSNQTTEYFDTFGTMAAGVQQAFIKNTLLKANVSIKSLQFMQDTGEHWMQTVLTNAILKSIKVLNVKGEFINKDGEVVKTEKEAASVSDMRRLDENGKMFIDPSVVYTTHTLGIKFNEGGREKLTQLVKKKVFDTAGAYDNNKQPEAMRHAKYKLVMMYRRFLIPMGVARFRGFTNVSNKVADLEDHQKFFSEGLQEYEFGTYTETLRYMWQGPIMALRKLQFSLITENWNELTDYQKKQIHKAVTEIVITSILLPALATLLKGLAEGDEDDDSWLWFLTMETRRLQSELSSYRKIEEQWKILKSPIPSLRLIEGATNLGGMMFSPTQWDERIQSGPNKDKLRWVREIEKFIPILNNTNSTYKSKWQYIENMAK